MRTVSRFSQLYWRAAKPSTGLVIMMTNILTLEGFCWGLCLSLLRWWMGQLQAQIQVFCRNTLWFYFSSCRVLGDLGKRMQGLFVLPRRYETWHSLQFFCSQPMKPRARLITWLPFILPSSKAEGRSFLLQRGGRSQDVAQESRSVRRTWGSASNSRASLRGGGRRGPLHQVWCPSRCCRFRFMQSYLSLRVAEGRLPLQVWVFPMGCISAGNRSTRVLARARECVTPFEQKGSTGWGSEPSCPHRSAQSCSGTLIWAIQGEVRKRSPVSLWRSRELIAEVNDKLLG